LNTAYFRQVHLDFHTSEHIANVGSRFDPEKFADTLVSAKVNSINCFARCHHGWMYYESKQFSERIHPTLERDLLREQIQACHERGIRVPVYVTVEWDHFTAMRHPEWVAVRADGGVESGFGTSISPYEPGFYRALLVNSPYRDFLKAHVRELLDLLDVDGFWFDIVKPLDDSSMWTQKGMEAEGLNPADPLARQAYGQQVINRFKCEMTEFIHQQKSDCTIFYNEGHISPAIRPTLDAYTHIEIESLPSGQWGYAHFPITARYARTLGKPSLGMTGKFHTEWGDFHSYKNRAALEFECFQMLVHGMMCSVGDQLHPSGEIDDTTYDLIGAVYEQIATKEPWCVNAEPVVDIGVMLTARRGERVTPEASGAMRMLQESGHQFDFIDGDADFSKYKLLVLPDSITLDSDLASRIQIYMEQGGSVIASYESGLLPDKSAFALDTWGVRYKGAAPYSPDFLVPNDLIRNGLSLVEHVMYKRGISIEPTNEAKTLAEVVRPYFNRTYRHFISHRHTPSDGEAIYPGIVQCDRVIYFSHPIFSQYDDNAPLWCKQLFLNAMKRLLPNPLLRHDGPSSLITTVTEQTQRLVVHLLHYIPVRSNQTIDVIEDIIPLYDINLQLRSDQPIEKVTLVPEQQELQFHQEEGYVNFAVPVIKGHQMICLQMGEKE